MQGFSEQKNEAVASEGEHLNKYSRHHSKGRKSSHAKPARHLEIDIHFLRSSCVNRKRGLPAAKSSSMSPLKRLRMKT